MYHASFIILYYNQEMHNYIINIYIPTVCLCNLHYYIFRHFRVIMSKSVVVEIIQRDCWDIHLLYNCAFLGYSKQ